MAQQTRIQLVSMRMWVRSLASLSGLSIQRAVSCGIGLRYDSDLALLWLWRRLAAVALIRPLAWELPYASRVPCTPQKACVLLHVMPEEHTWSRGAA